MSRRTVACACCGAVGPHRGRGLIASCYGRAYEEGTLDRWPTVRRRTARRQGARLRERRAAYLALRTSGMKQAAAAARVGISVKTAYRYEHDEGGRP
ncbi:helix-turn-helix domain-containing protein [Nocardiopsis composta]|uniref:Helix-turn-helix domain-containing protein n=1 Tax=Nocardiopsis composta TaxID=157465 RepID=A0A7W8QJI2_9ACTN|nr:helix-turn-helix transcriptional regulator [Nocardiopsis composta]MBB5431389.1 hypothetical protein [Nocardiopsis composta]